jgi:Predicted O-methyltransferase
VLPDAAPKDDGAGLFSTSLVRDLQFYPTPEATVSDVLRDVFPPNGARVLEPSAGTGALVKGLLRKESVAHLTAIEVHPDRVARLRDIVDHRLEIREANFLQCAPSEEFDLLVMNPPFYGTHWMDHVRHAFAFLKPGGRLVSILPASAELKEDAKHLSFRRWAEQQARSWRRMWRDLPSESFAESGTRINTVLLDIERRATP